MICVSHSLSYPFHMPNLFKLIKNALDETSIKIPFPQSPSPKSPLNLDTAMGQLDTDYHGMLFTASLVK